VLRAKSISNPATAFSLIEVLVVIAILALLLAILAPSLGKAKDQVRRVMCRNNLRQWGVALQFYRSDFNDHIPAESSAVPQLTIQSTLNPRAWFNVLPPYLGAPKYKDIDGVGINIKEYPALHVWICPAKNLGHLNTSLSHKNQFHYAMNRVLDGTGSDDDGDEGITPDNVCLPANRFLGKPNTVFMFDVYPNSPNQDPRGVATEFHRNSANVLYLDGGVADFKSNDFVMDGERIPNGEWWTEAEIVWRHPRLYWGYVPE
jgi:prepilin-type N-terminal cleavage/methylation domain-containing protein/prepilin-type processing-associated H-X9-DG protein